MNIHFRQLLVHKAEEIREKAAEAEPRAAELKKRLEDHGPNANAAACAKFIQVVIELKQPFGIVVTARTDGGQ